MREDRLERLRTFLEEIFRRDLDIIGALCCLLLTAPVFLFLALLMTTDGGAMLFAHRRIGRYGIGFNCWKLRTMVVGAEECLTDYLYYNPEAMAEWKRDHKLEVDPRITPIGRFLRRTSLDELPQMWNVLVGDMSLVGPRPVTEREMRERYGQYAGVVMSVKPGITGAWQVSGRNDVDYEHRILLDAHYVRSRRLITDIGILFKTISVVIARNGAR